MVALLTPAAHGGITVIALAGPGSLELLSRLFVSPRGVRLRSAPPGKLLYGKLVLESCNRGLDRNGETLDEVVVCRVPSPRGLVPAFEINCHGGALPARRVLDALVDLGARETAWPGLLEAQRSAGALDAIQAEAEAALPGALNLPAARMLLAQGRGALSEHVRRALALLPSDPAGARRLAEQALAAARHGRRLVDPARVGVAGRPNVGKSSLMNALLRHERVIVHHLPGTTRDVIEDKCDVLGLPVRLADMAGVRDASDAIEAEAVRRALRAMQAVDLLLLVLDGSEPLHPEDLALLRGTASRPRVLAVNKADLPLILDLDLLCAQAGSSAFAVSALRGDGLPQLEAALVEALAGPCPDLDGPVPFTERQEGLLRAAACHLAGEPPHLDAARQALRELLDDPLLPAANAKSR